MWAGPETVGARPRPCAGRSPTSAHGFRDHSTAPTITVLSVNGYFPTSKTGVSAWASLYVDVQTTGPLARDPRRAEGSPSFDRRARQADPRSGAARRALLPIRRAGGGAGAESRQCHRAEQVAGAGPLLGPGPYPRRYHRAPIIKSPPEAEDSRGACTRRLALPMQAESYLFSPAELQPVQVCDGPELLPSADRQEPLWIEVGRTCVVAIFKWLTPSRPGSWLELSSAPHEVGPRRGRSRYAPLLQFPLSSPAWRL